MQGVNILKNEGIVKNEFLLLVLGKITMTERKLRAGYYNLNSTMSLWDVFNNLRKGMVIQYAITIPEGSTLEDIKLKLENKRLMDDESWKLVKDKNFLESLGINSPSLEGYLYPDTYNFAKGTDPENIFKMMVEKLRENFSAPLMQKAEKTDMTENEVLTLASIIEREAGVDEERPLISAVYHNRLRKKMPLQADPTAIYGMKKSGREITRSDLKRRTPYNTYVINGLPPGPIASPGIKSIKAAIDPADVNYIYFVSKNDGTHHFSSTPEEHLEAVILYQKNKEDNAKNPKEKTN
ncbi:MAG: endolytic transglycosylase MltG [Nitrospirae bacterium]|nr:endolytic transglycosylase MltG [Nitrospirota bacterium]